MPSKITMRRIIGTDSKGPVTDKVSLWQKDAIKLHAHSLSSDDKIITEGEYGAAYCCVGDTIIGLSNGVYRAKKEPHSNSTKKSIDFKGNDIHIISNQGHIDGPDEVLGCAYGTNKVFYWNSDTDNYQILIPVESENQYIGVQYVDGLWLLIADGSVYYTTDISKGFNNKKFSDEKKFARIRYNQTCVCKYGEYYYVIGIGDYGEFLRIQINAQTKNIVKIYTGTSNDFGTSVVAIPITSASGMGQSPAIVTMKSNHYLTIWTGESPEDMKDYNQFETNIYCRSSGKCVGFECGKRILSLLFNRDGSQKLESILVDLNTKKIIYTGADFTSYVRPEIWGFDTGEYYAAYSYTPGKEGTSLHSSVNGIDWYHNWGYLYTENVNKTHNPITSIIKSMNQNSSNNTNGLYVGTKDTENEKYTDTTLEIPININFIPKRIYYTSHEIVNNIIETDDAELIFEDRHGELWQVQSQKQINIDQTVEASVIYNLFDFETGVWHQKLDDNNCVKVGTCYWNGNGVVITLDDKSDNWYATWGSVVANDKKNRLYRWWAM